MLKALYARFGALEIFIIMIIIISNTHSIQLGKETSLNADEEAKVATTIIPKTTTQKGV